MASGQRLAREIRGEIEKATGEKAAVAVEDGVVRLSGRFGCLWTTSYQDKAGQNDQRKQKC